MKKDRVCTVRINQLVLEAIKDMDLSPQMILDKWISLNLEVTEKVQVKKKEKK